MNDRELGAIVYPALKQITANPLWSALINEDKILILSSLINIVQIEIDAIKISDPNLINDSIH